MNRVYKIINSIDEKIYIGCTLNTLKHRMMKHIVSSRISLRQKTYLYNHFKYVGLCNFNIILLEERKCLEKKDKRKFEQEWMDKLNPELNMINAFTSKEDRRKRKKEYYNRTKERRISSRCECGGRISICHKVRHNNTLKHIKYIKKIDLNE